uniref:Uncharacterized protein n=1 Tax=Anopheles melas TaxID=34690 RepID=A0A182U6N8_9DIPT
MMEDNTISMFMDVKLDIRERKLEFSHMKSWSRYFVRVEAVKCFPCYMRISFFSSPTDLTTDLIVRINIPGLTVQMATSRTKQHSYGLFWKNNRKRCCAYFALETQLLCERHLRWMKKSIRNLELYRQEMMQLRRASRTPMYEIRQEMQPLDPLADGAGGGTDACDNMGIYQNLDNTQNIMDLQDILGPLPTVPVVVAAAAARTDSSAAHNWSRRVSGMSGIYEEIRDDLAAGNASRLSRASIASGIYEEMRLDPAGASEPIGEAISTPPPPLPPRKRLNTNEDFEELQRSYTAPEVELMKKKRHHWLRLESVFGRKRTTSTNSQDSAKKSTCRKESKADTKSLTAAAGPSTSSAVVHRDKVGQLRLVENKRNSFSSPDLSRLKVSDAPGGGRHDEDGGAGNVSCDNLSDGVGSCTSEFFLQPDIDYIEEDCCFGSSEYINMSGVSLSSELPAAEGDKKQDHQQEGFSTVLPDMRRLNISERVFEGFNGSVNSSTVNLVGCVAAIEGNGCETETSSLPQASLVERPPPPIRASELDGYLEMGPVGTGFNRQKLLNEAVIYRNNPLPAEDAAPHAVECVSSGGSPKLYQKYATLARISSPPSSKCMDGGKQSLEANVESACGSPAAPTPTSNTPVSKRFGSLPRFGKFDLSPLRMKINSVLQRHNSGNL